MQHCKGGDGAFKNKNSIFGTNLDFSIIAENGVIYESLIQRPYILATE